MSFICEFCKESTPARRSMKRLVVDTRVKEYPVGAPGVPPFLGSEIVLEKAWCGDCSGGMVYAAQVLS